MNTTITLIICTFPFHLLYEHHNNPDSPSRTPDSHKLAFNKYKLL